jgi:hypothetical protein
VVDEARRRHGDDPVAVRAWLRSRAATGDTAALGREFARLLVPGAGAATVGMLREVALELRAHGADAAAQRLLVALQALVEADAGGPASPPLAAERVRIAVAAGDLTAADAALAVSLPADFAAPADHGGWRALVAARRGVGPDAARAIAALRASPPPYERGRIDWWEAAVLATHGRCDAARAALARARTRGQAFGLALHAGEELAALRRCPGGRQVAR